MRTPFTSVLAAVAMGASTWVVLIGIFFCIQGLCQSTGWGPLSKNFGNFFSQHERGTKMGWWNTCYAVGGLVAGVYAGYWADQMGDWRFAFQSKGRGGGQWMEPEADDVVRTLADEGWKKVLVVPVGFVSDNVETLYDLDIVLRRQIEGLDMEYRRSVAPNDSPIFIEALADVVIDYLARRPVEHQMHRPDGPHTHG